MHGLRRAPSGHRGGGSGRRLSIRDGGLGFRRTDVRRKLCTQGRADFSRGRGGDLPQIGRRLARAQSSATPFRARRDRHPIEPGHRPHRVFTGCGRSMSDKCIRQRRRLRIHLRRGRDRRVCPARRIWSRQRLARRDQALARGCLVRGGYRTRRRGSGSSLGPGCYLVLGWLGVADGWLVAFVNLESGADAIRHAVVEIEAPREYWRLTPAISVQSGIRPGSRPRRAVCAAPALPGPTRGMRRAP